MYLNAKIRATIILQETGNTVLLPYVTSVSVSNDSQHIGATCDLVVPLNQRIEYGVDEKTNKSLTAPLKQLFQTGDQIKIEASYDGYPTITVFEGFLFDFYEGTPMKIKCYDYIYRLNFVAPITISYPDKKGNPDRIKLSTFIAKILDGTEISLITIKDKYTDKNGALQTNTLYDLTLFNISFVSMTPAAILEHLKKELGFNISLDGNKLYVNIASNTVSTAKFDTRQNVFACDLQPNRLTVGTRNKSLFQNIKVKAWFYREDTGKKESIEVGDPTGQNRDVFFYRIDVRGKTDAQKTSIYTKLANEALEKFKQRRFNGTIETYLYPNVDLFWRVEYFDYSYPERNGIYSVTSIEITLDESGFHRKIKLAYLGELV